MSFLLVPDGQRTQMRLTIFVSLQQYAGGQSGAYYREELGLATDEGLYKAWFGLVDRAVAR